MRFLAHIRNAVFAVALTTIATLAQDFNADCQALTKHPHRLSGTREYAEAADYVYGRLKAMKPDDLFEQTSPPRRRRPSPPPCKSKAGPRLS